MLSSLFLKGVWIGAILLASTHAFVTVPSSGLVSSSPLFLNRKQFAPALRSSGQSRSQRYTLQLRASSVPPGEEPMSLSAYDQLVLTVRALTPAEIKQELDTRGISHADCFEKEELVFRLVEARLQIAAEAIGEGEIKVGEDDQIEKTPLEAEGDAEEETVKRDSRVFNEDLMSSLDKEKLEAMLQDQELMRALRNPAVLRMAQEVLKDPSCMDNYSGDPDVLVAIQKVKDFLQSSGAK